MLHKRLKMADTSTQYPGALNELPIPLAGIIAMSAAAYSAIVIACAILRYTMLVCNFGLSNSGECVHPTQLRKPPPAEGDAEAATGPTGAGCCAFMRTICPCKDCSMQALLRRCCPVCCRYLCTKYCRYADNGLSAHCNMRMLSSYRSRWTGM